MVNLAAVNIKGVFNTSNVTKYEKDPPDGMGTVWFPLSAAYTLSLFKSTLSSEGSDLTFFDISGVSIDFKFYKTLWSLQV